MQLKESGTVIILLGDFSGTIKKAETVHFLLSQSALRRPGIEPGSAVWDTTMLATTPPALPASCEPNASKVQPNAVQGTLCVGRGGWRCAA